MPPARRMWMPVLSRVYGIPPWEAGRLTGREWDLIVEDLDAMAKAGFTHVYNLQGGIGDLQAAGASISRAGRTMLCEPVWSLVAL